MINLKAKRFLSKSFGFAISSIILLNNPVFANPDKLQSGPMVGYSEMRETLLWVQTKKEAKVKFIYWDKENPDKKYQTKEIRTKENKSFTAKLIVDQVSPGKKYDYDLYIDSVKVTRPYPTSFQTPPLWQWRTDPPEFKVAIGSCTYVIQPEFDRPGKPYGGNYEIFTSIYDKKPDIMLWMGDNIYLRETDWYSRTGIFNRYTHTRSLPEMQPLLASTLNYAIIDDHDFGPNDSDKSYRNKDDSIDAFRLFWGNPSYGKNDSSGFTKFEWGDVEFFLLDNRTFRDPNKKKGENKSMLGAQQLNWLIDSLISSQATFKIIASGTQILNPVNKVSVEDYMLFPEEKEQLFSALKYQDIKGVMFLTGDRHQTELAMLKRDNTYPLYDLTVSPLTASAYDSSKEDNYLRLPDTLVTKRNFAIMNVLGKKKDRKLVFTIYDTDGKELWNKEIKESELR
jgi:alkaline phosphatase D